jgi:hypothetical protein
MTPCNNGMIHDDSCAGIPMLAGHELDVKIDLWKLNIGRDKISPESDPSSVENPLQSTDDQGQTMVPEKLSSNEQLAIIEAAWLENSHSQTSADAKSRALN